MLDQSWRGNCTTESGLPYQIGLYYGPVLFLSVLNIAEVLGVTAKLCAGAYRTEGSLQRYHITAIKEVVPIFIYPAIFFLTFLFGLAHRISSALLLVEGKPQNMAMWVTFALVVSIKGLYLPVAFMLHPYIWARLMCNTRNQRISTILVERCTPMSLVPTHHCTDTCIYTDQTHYVVSEQSNCSETPLAPLIIKSGST